MRTNLMAIIFTFCVIPSIAQNDISIIWENMPQEVTEPNITIKWHVKANSQITGIVFTLNGNIQKGLNAVVNDNYDITQSRALTLAKGQNLLELVVTTLGGKQDSQKKIFYRNSNNIDDDDISDNISDIIEKAYSDDVEAQYHLGEIYLVGRNGLKKDLFESSLWFKKSAEMKYAPSQYEFAVALMEGRGVLVNNLLAIHWLEEAANADYDKALLKLGICYETGNGVTKDIEKAKSLYKRCSLQEAKLRLNALIK